MILAFINNPLQTIFTYIAIVMFAGIIYSFCFTIYSGVHLHQARQLITSLSGLVALLSVLYCLITMLNTISLGSFRDFQELRTLLVPFIIAMFTYFAFNNKAKKDGQQNSAEDPGQQNSPDVIGLQNLHFPEDIENSQDGLPTTDEQE